MVWFRVDDGFATHPKVVGLSLAAVGLWAKAGAWCSQHLTDGAIPLAAVKSLGGTSRLASELTVAHLWRATPDGYQFHEWEHHQPTREYVEKKRDEARVRMGKRSRSSENVRANNEGISDSVRVPRPDPVPSRPKEEEKSAPHIPEIPEPRLDPTAVTALDVMRVWVARAQSCVGGPVSHTMRGHERDYSEIADVVNQLPQDARGPALLALVTWFWCAGSGPVVSGRVKPARATPGTLAKNITSDLASAHEWWVAEGKPMYGR